MVRDFVRAAIAAHTANERTSITYRMATPANRAVRDGELVKQHANEVQRAVDQLRALVGA